MSKRDVQEIRDMAAELYSDNGLPLNVNAAFVAEGIEPPTRVESERGYTSAQSKIIDKWYRATEPYADLEYKESA